MTLAKDRPPTEEEVRGLPQRTRVWNHRHVGQAGMYELCSQRFGQYSLVRYQSIGKVFRLYNIGNQPGQVHVWLARPRQPLRPMGMDSRKCSWTSKPTGGGRKTVRKAGYLSNLMISLAKLWTINLFGSSQIRLTHRLSAGQPPVRASVHPEQNSR